MEDERPKQPPKPPHQPHDKLFKAVFKSSGHVREILGVCAPEPLLNVLNLKTLRTTDASFVDPELTGSMADIVLECRTHRGGKALITLILEHKSTVPQYPPYQIMRYQQQVWDWEVRTEGQRPSPIIPLLFYHGDEHWEVKRWEAYLSFWDEALVHYTPPGGYLFVDLSGLPDELIRNFRSAFLKTALLLMKHRFDGTYLLTNLQEIFNFVESDERLSGEAKLDILQMLLRYLQSLNSIEWRAVKKALYPLNLTTEVMSVMEELKLEAYYEGRQEGLEEGLQEGIEQGIGQGIDKEARSSIRSLILNMPGADDETIANLLSKPLELVAEVRQALIDEAAATQEEE